MFKRLGLAVGSVVVAATSLATPLSASAASISTPGFFSTGSVDCVSPGYQLRIRTPSVGTLWPNDRLTPTYVEASAYFRLSYDGKSWSSWTLARNYARKTANYYAVASWDDTVLTLRADGRMRLVQVIYSAFRWNGATWLRNDLQADSYMSYMGADSLGATTACVIA